MIIDQLFNPKPLEEGGPYDLPGKDYDRPGDTPRKQSSGEQNPYPYSPEEDDDYFREIFRKKREAAAKDQGMAEGPTDDPRFQKMMGNIQKSTPKYVPVTGYVAVSFASEQGSKKIKGVSRNGKPIPTNIGDPDQFLSGKIEFTPDQVEQQLMSIGKKYGWDSIDSGQSQGFTEMFFDTAKEYTSNNYPYLATNIVKTVKEINKFFADINKSLQTTGLSGYVSDVWQGMGPPENTNQIEDLDQIISIAKKTAPKADPGPEIGKVILANYKRFGGEDGYSRSELDQAAKIAKIYITQGERAGFQAQYNSDVSDLIDELLSDAGSDVRTIYTDDPLNPMQIEDQGVAEKVGDLRPKLGSARDKGKSVRKWRNDRGLNESMLMEDPVYRDFRRMGQYISEQKLTEPEILQVFADAEAGMTDKATGANRTFVGRGKDATMDFAKDVAGSVNGVLKSIQDSVPVAAVDVAYDQATDALANLTGGQKGAAMAAIKKYRNLVKQYPKTAGFAKAALVAIAGLATGGAGLPAIAGLTYALDSAIKGDKLSSVLGKGAGTAALAAAGQGIFGGSTQPGTGETDSIAGLVDPTPDLATYTVQQGDTLSQIAQANDTTVQELVGLNPQLAAASGATGGQNLNPDVIFPGQQITLPPGTPGTDVYASGVGTSADTMTDIAKGNVPDSAISQGMAAKGQAAADAVSGRADNLANMTQQAGGVPIDYAKPGPVSTDSLGQKLEYGMPVNDRGSFIPPNPALPPEELAKQTAAYNSWKSDFMKRFPNATLLPNGEMQAIKPGLAPMFPGMTPKTFESVKLKIIPASRLIDQKATVLNWALNESVGRKSNSVNLTPIGTLTVFENVDRYRRALLEYTSTQPGRPELPNLLRPDMPGAPVTSDTNPGMIGRGLNALDRFTSKVGGGLGNFGRQFTTGVTKEKLKMNWQQDDKPTDSDQLAAWLVTQKVPQEVVTDVFSKMGIPYTATAQPATAQPAAPKAGGASTQAYAGINPATKKPWTQQELRDKFYPEPAATDATDDAEDTTGGGAGAFSSMAGRLTKPSTTTSSTGGTTSVDQAKGITTNRASANNPNRQAATAAGGAGTKTTTSPSLASSFSSNPTDMKVTYGSGFKPTTATLPAGGGAGVKAAVQTKPGFLQTATDKISAKSKTQSMNSNDTQAEIKAGLAARRAAGVSAYESKTNGSRIFQALKRPVTEMLQMVETKEDVQKIKQFVDDTFIKYGAVNESAFAVRNRIIEHVTKTGAQRRREHSQRVAH